MEVLARIFLVPVQDSAHKWRDERRARLGCCDGLVHSEEQGQVAVDAFLLEHFGGADAFPCGSDLDEHMIAADARLIVLRDDAAGLRGGGFGIVGKARVHLGRDATGHDGQNLFAEGDGQTLEGQVGHGLIRCAIAKLLARVHQDTVYDGLVLRHLRGGGNQRRVGGGIGGAKLLHRLNVSRIGNHHGVLAQLLK